jgi:hypothetical protein
MTAPSTHTQSFVFQPDDEHRSRISDCVRKDGIQLNCRGIIDFAHNIETSIATFLKAKANTSESYRQARNALRDLWQLSHEADDDISVRRTSRAITPPSEACARLPRYAGAPHISGTA